MTTIFGKIIAGELPCDKVFENERILVIKDINPAAPIHLLIIPKKEIKDLQSATSEDLALVTECISVAQQLADRYDISDGYRLITNNGSTAGQTVFHLHFHLIGGRTLGALC
jgi:histidine triad (HIT) family protein